MKKKINQDMMIFLLFFFLPSKYQNLITKHKTQYFSFEHLNFNSFLLCSFWVNLTCIFILGGGEKMNKINQKFGNLDKQIFLHNNHSNNNNKIIEKRNHSCKSSIT